MTEIAGDGTARCPPAEYHRDNDAFMTPAGRSHNGNFQSHSSELAPKHDLHYC